MKQVKLFEQIYLSRFFAQVETKAADCFPTGVFDAFITQSLSMKAVKFLLTEFS